MRDLRVVRDVPLYPAVGNHDAVFGFLDYYLGFFDLPPDERNYSFNYGSAAFVVLDTEQDLNTGANHDWLVSTLAARKAEGYPLLFVVMHQPVYTFCAEHFPYEGGAENLAPVFQQAGVRAVLGGHNHCYEHFLAGGVHYFTLGGGGASLTAIDSHIPEGQEDLEVKALSAHHHAIIRVDGGSATVTVYDDDKSGEVIEEISL